MNIANAYHCSSGSDVPGWAILAYAVVGLVVALAVSRALYLHDEEHRRDAVTAIVAGMGCGIAWPIAAVGGGIYLAITHKANPRKR